MLLNVESRGQDKGSEISYCPITSYIPYIQAYYPKSFSLEVSLHPAKCMIGVGRHVGSILLLVFSEMMLILGEVTAIIFRRKCNGWQEVNSW
jgi:hypothetical protein